MSNDYTISGYHLSYLYDKDIYKFDKNYYWLIKTLDFTNIKTIDDLKKAYQQCGAFDRRVGDFLTKNFYKNFIVTYKGSILKNNDLLPDDTISDDFLIDIY